MSSIAAGTTGTTGLVHTSDTTGDLVFKTGGSATTAMTIDSSQAITVSGTLTPICASYQWTDWDATNLTGTATNAPSTAAATVTATGYMTMANSSGTVTFTFTKAGNYLITITGCNEYANTPIRGTDKVNLVVALGGTATRLISQIQSVLGLICADLQNNGTNSGPNGCLTFLVTATTNQTLTILPTARLNISTGGATTSQFTYSCNATALYVGT